MESESKSRICIADFDSLVFPQLRQQFRALQEESKYSPEPVTYIGEWNDRVAMFRRNIKYAITVFKNTAKHLNDVEIESRLKLIEDIYEDFHWKFEDKAFAKTWNIFQDEEQ
jgi:hypothetical protein